jgi:hypothetical protein
LKRVVIEMPVETVIRPEVVTADQIIIGRIDNYWHKLSKFYVNRIDKFQWCSLSNSDSYAGCCSEGFSNVKDAIKAFLKEHSEPKVYVFDSLDEFLSEFPTLVKSKKQ